MVVSGLHIKFAEVLVANLTMGIWVATFNKVLDVIVTNLEVQVG